MVGVRLPLQTLLGIGTGGPQQLIPASIIEADVDLTPLVVGGDLPGALAQVPELLRQRGQVPEKLHLHPVPLHLSDGLQEILFQQPHDGSHLLRRTLPVFGGKGVYRQILQSDLLAVGGNGAEGLRPGGVSGGAGQAPLPGPTAVSIHDDGDVAGQAGQIRLDLLRWFKKEHNM